MIQDCVEEWREGDFYPHYQPLPVASFHRYSTVDFFQEDRQTIDWLSKINWLDKVRCKDVTHPPQVYSKS